jgi:SulP family sulfate permease
VAVLRLDGPLDYSTLGFFERAIERVLASRPTVRHVLLAGHTLGRIDAVAAEEVIGLFERLRALGYHVCISGLKDEVLELLQRAGVHRAIGEGCIFPTQARALERILPETHQESEERLCPLTTVVSLRGVEGA